MTNTRSSADIRAELAANALAFNKAREDAELYERLSKAPALVAKLAARGDDLTAALAKAEEAEATARREEAYSHIRNMRVETVAGKSSSPIGAQYIIRFEREAYSSTTHRNEWISAEANGFAVLTPEQFGYLLDKAPEQIPAGIRNLVPDNPRRAFEVYFIGMRRGYLTA